VCRRRFIVLSSLLHSGASDSHKEWISSRGPGHQVFAEIMTGNLVYLAFAIGTRGTERILPVLPYIIALGTFAWERWSDAAWSGCPRSGAHRRIAFAVE
jgi:hypothetical protein